MKQIFLANPKGGCGKTTLATQLASYYAGLGNSVALVDHDRQQSSMDWLRCRPKACAGIVPVAAFRGEVADEEFDYVIHDLPAASSVADLESFAHDNASHHLLIPVLPSPTDIKAVVRFLMSLNGNRWLTSDAVEVGLVANRVKSRTRYHSVLTEFLQQVNVPLIASLRDSQNYIRAMDAGVAIFDLPKSRVETDLTQWKPLLSWLQADPSKGVG
jgi:chromosome partitioning protein